MKLKGAPIARAVAMVDGHGKPSWQTFKDAESLLVHYPLANRTDYRNVVVMTEADYVRMKKQLPPETGHG
jgi:hypothetical protein